MPIIHLLDQSAGMDRFPTQPATDGVYSQVPASQPDVTTWVTLHCAMDRSRPQDHPAFWGPQDGQVTPMQKCQDLFSPCDRLLDNAASLVLPTYNDEELATFQNSVQDVRWHLEVMRNQTMQFFSMAVFTSQTESERQLVHTTLHAYHGRGLGLGLVPTSLIGNDHRISQDDTAEELAWARACLVDQIRNEKEQDIDSTLDNLGEHRDLLLEVSGKSAYGQAASHDEGISIRQAMENDTKELKDGIKFVQDILTLHSQQDSLFLTEKGPSLSYEQLTYQALEAPGIQEGSSHGALAKSTPRSDCRFGIVMGDGY